MNSIFDWGKDFFTGNETVDEQHKDLINMINKAAQISITMQDVSADDISILKESLSKYVEYHFKTEEEIMQTYKIDTRHTKSHFTAHKEFIKHIDNFFNNPELFNNTDLYQEFIEYLIRWLAYHILNIDKSFIRQLENIKQGIAPADAFKDEEKYIENTSEPLLKALRALFYIVSQKNKELEDKNQNLEKEVYKRTLELQKTNKKLEKLSMTDVLTDLPNRRYAMQSLEDHFQAWKRYKNIFSIISIDADKFKEVNDTFGHEYGDKVIKWIADFLTGNLRSSDIICRLGGDEFLVICPNSDIKGVKNAGESLIQKYSLINKTSPLEYWRISLSIGATEISEEIDSIDALLQKADKAMYSAKKNGRGRLVVI